MADNFIYPGKPKSKEELEQEAKRKEAQEAKKNMVDYAKAKDIHDKIEFADELLTTAGIMAAALKGLKSTTPQTQNDTAKKAAKAGNSAGVSSYKMAAGAEGYDPNVVRESLNTDDLSFQEGINMKNALNDAKTKLGGSNYDLEPEADLSEFNKEINPYENTKPEPIKKLSTTRRLLNAVKEGFETISDQKNASRKNYASRNRENTAVLPNIDAYRSAYKKRNADVLKMSLRDQKGNVVEMNWDELAKPVEPKPADSKSLNKLGQAEAKMVDKVITFMDNISVENPKVAKEIREFKDKLGLGKIDGGKISSEAWNIIMNEMDGKKPERNVYALMTRKEPIKQGILSSMTDTEIINNGRKVLGSQKVSEWLKANGSKAAKELIADAIATLTAQMLYSSEKSNIQSDKELDKLTDKVVKGNRAQFADKGAKVWLKDKAKVWDNWLNSFDAESMDNEADYRTFLEATQLMDDYNKNRNIITNSGNNNPMVELLTNPKYVRLLLKYNPI